ncbi:MAG: N-acetylglucosamine-6-phosphate deacetylase [Bacillota bacterium]|nr:N-acetylglucosamine-6-phosphate deacetylase [Bacillota bacterium]
MATLLLVNGKAIMETGIMEEIYIYIENEHIAETGPLTDAASRFPHAEEIIIPKEHIVVPGFIDIHIHGVAGADTMDATPEALSTIAAALPSEGTTSFLATTITQKQSNIEQALKNIADYSLKSNTPGHAELLGIHLEGPFINAKRAGAQPKEHILKPDIALFKRWQHFSNHQIKLVTLAPEMENGLDMIAFLKKEGVIASIGHTDADYAAVQAAVEAGARHVTHLFNGMKGMHHREPGTAGAALLFNELTIELIADGLHIAPEMVRLILACKGVDSTILITDSMRAKCLKNGIYDLGGQSVSSIDGKALLPDGTLAGSLLKMNEALRNILAFTPLSLWDAVQMVSVNPAKQLGLFSKKGSITPSKDADIVILDEHFEVQRSFCRGKQAFSR